jgi:hypothetical protein
MPQEVFGRLPQHPRSLSSGRASDVVGSRIFPSRGPGTHLAETAARPVFRRRVSGSPQGTSAAMGLLAHPIRWNRDVLRIIVERRMFLTTNWHSFRRQTCDRLRTSGTARWCRGTVARVTASASMWSVSTSAVLMWIRIRMGRDQIAQGRLRPPPSPGVPPRIFRHHSPSRAGSCTRTHRTANSTRNRPRRTSFIPSRHVSILQKLSC